MSRPGDELLRNWCSQRDPEAFRAIVGRHAGMVYSTCCRVLRDAAEAEDVTQECFEALVMARRPPYHYLGPWLHRVATNLSLKRLRESGRRKEREQQYADAQGAHSEPTWDDVYQCVDEVIAALPEKLRVPIASHFLEGMTHEAIARQMGIAPPTVRYRIAKGLERISADLRRRHITAGAGTLAALFASHFTEAVEVPSSLTASLGKLALAQSAKGIGGLAGGWLTQQMLTKVLIAAVIPSITVISTVLLVNRVDPSGDTVVADRSAKSEPVITAPGTTPRSEPAAPRTDTSGPAAAGASDLLTRGVPAEFLYLFEPIEKGPGAVFGTITDPDGEPVAGARVTLFSRDSWWKHGYAETITNARGVYEIKDLPVSRSYQLTAVSERGMASAYVALYLFSDLAGRLAQFGAPPVFTSGDTPGALAGQRCRRNLSIRPITTAPMTGRVLDPDGTTVEGAIVATAGNPYLAAGLSQNVRTTSDGRFAIHNILTPEEKSSLVAYAKGYAPTMIHDVPPESSGIDIVLNPAHRIAGVARLKETGQPVTGRQVTLQTVSDLDPRNVAVTDQNGAFAFDGLAAKLYAISLTDTEAGLVSIESHKLDLRQADSIDDVELLVSPGASISGKVYIEETGEPIAGVHVRISHTRTGDSVRESVTGPDGTYLLQFLSAGKYGLKCIPPENVVRHFHYMDQGLPGPTQEAEVGPEDHRTGIDFTFQGGVSVSGQVTGPGGVPIEGASMFAVNSQRGQQDDGQAGQGLPLQTSATFTDRDGYYTLHGFSPSTEWTYTIRISALGYAPFESEPFHVTAAMDDESFVLQPAAAVSGIVVTLRGEPLPFVGIGMLPTDRNSHKNRVGGFSGPNGRFIISTGVPPGEYQVEASGFFSPNLDIPFDGRTMNPTITVEDTRSVQGLRIVVPTAAECATLAGTVFAKDTSLAVADAKVEVARVVSENGDDYGPSRRFQAGPGPGAFRLTGVFPGTVTLRAQAEGYPIQDVYTLKVEPGADIAALRLMLRPPEEVTVAIQGTVYVDGSPLSPADGTVYCRPLDAPENSHQSTVSEDGIYRIENLEPRSYALTVAAGQSTADQQFRWMRLETVVLETEPGMEYTQDFELSGSCALHGYVAAPPNADDVWVTVGVPNPADIASSWQPWRLDSPQIVIAATHPTSNGEYLIRGIPPGTYTVTASCMQSRRGQPAHAPVTAETVTFSPGQEATLDFKL